MGGGDVKLVPSECESSEVSLDDRVICVPVADADVGASEGASEFATAEAVLSFR